MIVLMRFFGRRMVSIVNQEKAMRAIFTLLAAFAASGSAGHNGSSIHVRRAKRTAFLILEQSSPPSRSENFTKRKEKRMIRANLSLLAVFAVLAAPKLGTANETPKPEMIEPVNGKLCVYGGACSRSISFQGAYENLQDAFAAAETYRTKRKLRFVTVRTGAHKNDYIGDRATQYKVYRRGVGCGNWFLYATVESADKAKDIADMLRTELSPVEIVRHYATE
jgi:hypothetical protein